MARTSAALWPGWRRVAAVVLALVVAGLVLDRTSSDRPAGIVELGATQACAERFVPSELQAPGSAEYDLHATGGPTTFAVTGTVDAESASGDATRDRVTCVVTLVGGERWRLDSLTWS